MSLAAPNPLYPSKSGILLAYQHSYIEPANRQCEGLKRDPDDGTRYARNGKNRLFG